MRSLSIKYPTLIRQLNLSNKLFILETIRDLDEAIELICDAMTDEEKLDPFAEDLCPYFGILWPSSIALAKHLSLHPSLVRNKTVLELGCGLGLPSMVASHLESDVLATDFHPDVEYYFNRNCRHSVIECSYQRLNWREDADSLGKFDLVMGSDVLYEGQHPFELTQSLLRFVKPGGKILLTDPGRTYLQRFMEAMTSEGYQEELTTLEVEGKEIFIIEYTV